MRATRVAGARRPMAGARNRALTVNVRNANVLIANTKGGGHAFIGLYLAKELLKKGHKVTIMNDGDEVGCACKPIVAPWQANAPACGSVYACLVTKAFRTFHLQPTAQ